LRITHLRLKPATQRFAIVVPDLSLELGQLTFHSQLLDISFIHVTRAFRPEKNYPRRINRRAQRPPEDAVIELPPIQRNLVCRLLLEKKKMQLRRQHIIYVKHQYQFRITPNKTCITL